MHVISTSVAPRTLRFVGVVQSVSGSTITLTGAAGVASGGSSDNLVFATWAIAG